MTFPFPRLITLGFLMIPAVPVLAQDAPAPQSSVAPDGVPAKPMSDQDKRVNFVDKQLAPRIAQDPAGALASVHEFLGANPTLDHWQRVLVYSTSGSLLYSRTPAAKRAAVADSALGLLNEGLKEVQATPNPDAYIQSRDIKQLSHEKIQILIAEKKTAEAAKVLDQCWPLMLASTDNSSDWCKHWRDVRNQQGQPKLAVDGLVKAFEQRLPWRDQFPQSITQNIVDELLIQGKDDEALSWAKLTFLMCPFSESFLRDATKDVTRCFSTRDLSVAKANAFALAQTDPSALNPLDAVPLPQYDTAAIKAQLADPDAKLDPRVRLISLLTLGDYRDAMLLARSQLVTDVGNQDNALQVARVFKAKDGDMVRANQFLAFYQQGEGENPIPAFLKETDAPATTAAAR